jgi:hypothetical protein
MNTRIFYFIVFISVCTTAFGQHPLVGTWEMVSIKGTNAEGEKFSSTNSEYREVKIITPGHYMLIASDVEGDSLVFNRAYAGSITLKGDEYMEDPLLSSATIFNNVEKDFKWKVEGDKFIQSGTFVRPDGKKVILDELVFQRVKSKDSYPKNPAIGTWQLLSVSDANGKKLSYNTDVSKTLQVITPTHWMRCAVDNKKFTSAQGGTYTMDKRKITAPVKFASFALTGVEKFEFSQKVEGDKLYLKGVYHSLSGNVASEEVYQKVE